MIVYKYRNWKDPNHKELIYSNVAYLASPKDFNDPFDCRITPDFSMLNTDDKIDRFIRQVVSDANKVDKGINVEQEINRLRDRLGNDFASSMQIFKELHLKQQDDTYGILSLSKCWDSILMWSHYADKHRGFCVGFDLQLLSEVDAFGMGGAVNYADNFPAIDPQDQRVVQRAFTEVNNKASTWKYEEEYRLFTLIGTRTKERRLKLPGSCFKEILLGLRFPSSEITALREMVKDKSVRIFQITSVDRQFKLARREL